MCGKLQYNFLIAIFAIFAEEIKSKKKTSNAMKQQLKYGGL